jgi:hypothetical protein
MNGKGKETLRKDCSSRLALTGKNVFIEVWVMESIGWGVAEVGEMGEIREGRSPS